VTLRGRRPRPAKATGPIIASLLTVLGWAAVAHNSGSGWVQAMGCLLAGFAVVGLLGPGVATARLRVSVTANPTDATLGHPVTITLVGRAPMRVEAIEPPGPLTIVTPGSGHLELVPARRGALREVVLAVDSAAPFGLLWWRKRVVVALAREMWVAPVPGRPDPALVYGAEPGSALEQHRPRDSRSGETRGVRPYVAGDPRRLVHWPATAHRGELMIREAERPDAAVPQVRVTLPDDGAAGDAAAARAMATVLELLARSAPVMLTTVERDGLHSEVVYGPTEAGRRLARAVAGR
jgi:uncharacterized protein (DUF58 family)